MNPNPTAQGVSVANTPIWIDSGAFLGIGAWLTLASGALSARSVPLPATFLPTLDLVTRV